MARKRKAIEVEKAIGRNLNFSEIPSDSDEWEFFAEEFLRKCGYKILQQVARGADQGRDLLVRGRDGVVYLVSCKHFSGRYASVTTKDEQDIRDRMEECSANGFIGFYSTFPAESLLRRLHELKGSGKIRNYLVYSGRAVESIIMSMGMASIVKQFLPKQYAKIKAPSPIFGSLMSLKCVVCGRELLNDHADVLWTESMSGGKTLIDNVCCVCKGPCSYRQEAHLFRLTKTPVLSEELCWLQNPIGYMQHMYRVLNTVRDKEYEYSSQAWSIELDLLAALSQKVMREVSEDDRTLMQHLLAME